jgi:proline iminopeptidase
MRVSIGDCRLFVDVDGLGLVPDGPTMRERPVLLTLHGGPGFDHTSFKPAFGELADVSQIVYVDHRGNGRSDRCDPSTWHFDQWADDIVALCDVLGVSRPFVYGVSFGSMVALHYAARHPGHACGIIADSTAAVADDAAVVAEFARLGGPDAAAAAQAFWDDPTAEHTLDYFATCMPLYNQRARPDAEDASARMLEHANLELFQHWTTGERLTYDFRHELAQVLSPTLVLAGEDDPITPIAGARVAAEALGEVARFVSFADCGHGVWRDQPDAAMDAIRSFVAEHS